MSKKTETYTQVKMVNGARYTVSKIPSKFAEVGRLLKLKNNDVWENGWTVAEVYTTESAETALSHERDYIHQREVSDI